MIEEVLGAAITKDEGDVVRDNAGLLGELRDPESIPILVKNMRYHHFSHHIRPVA